MEENTLEADIASNERNDDRKQTNEIFERVCELFSPLRNHWSLIQDILIWRKLEISVMVFDVLNGLFWVFLTPRLKLIVSVAILLSLVWMTPPIRYWILSSIQSLSTKRVENADSDDSTELLSEGEQLKSSGKQIISYEEFCYGVTVIWSFLKNCWMKLKNLRQENRQKFYLVVSFLVAVIAMTLSARFPIGNILYLTVMFLYLWPAIVFHGIRDKVAGKLRKLFRPFFTQWQSSRTKRKRDIVLKDHRTSDISEDEDFTLNATQNESILCSAILPEEKVEREQPTGPLDSVNSSLTFIDGLEFPSIRRDSVESFNSDDFVQGLNFSSIIPGSHHSSIDSLVGENDETIHSQKDETLHPQNDRPPVHLRNSELRTSEEYILSQSRSEYETEMRRRTHDEPASEVVLSRKKSTDNLESYEVIDTSEIQADLNKDNEQQAQDGSYIASGTAYVGKLFGYS